MTNARKGRQANMHPTIPPTERHIDLLFIGDSITEGWQVEGSAVWEKYYGKRTTLNLGVSGDQTQHVLWRLIHGQLDGVFPKVAILLIGTNNANGNDFTAEEIAAGVHEILSLLRHRLPRTRILLLGIFPRCEKPNAQRDKIASVNALIAKLADNKTIHYLDISKHFLNPDKTISPAIMPDYLHLSEEGYETWAAAMEPKLQALLSNPNHTPAR
ncbi:MAG: GDSL family lipase [Phycisphaerales bacterium]|nr:GDSL family lipase [Phycisphaerales bacterium]